MKNKPTTVSIDAVAVKPKLGENQIPKGSFNLGAKNQANKP